MKSKIIITVELDCDRDISVEHRHNLIMDSLSWVTHRLRKVYSDGGLEQGNLPGSGGKPCGRYMVSQFDEMDTYASACKWVGADFGCVYGEIETANAEPTGEN